MRLLIIGAVLFASCSTAKKSTQFQKTSADSSVLMHTDSSGFSYSESKQIDIRDHGETEKIIIDFDSCRSSKTQDPLITPTSFSIGRWMISNAGNVKKLTLETTGHNTESGIFYKKDIQNTQEKKAAVTEVQKKDLQKETQKEKSYSLPWYFWISIIIGILIVVLLVLKRYKII